MDVSSKRASPIGAVARNYLLQLINEERVLHSNSKSGRTMVLRRQAWARVTTKFNAAGYGSKKTVKQIMKIWVRSKFKVTQEEHVQEKREVQSTGQQLRTARLQQQAEQLKIELLKEQLKKARLEVSEQIENKAIRKKQLESEDMKVQLLQEHLRKARMENADLQLRLKLPNCSNEIVI